MERCLTFYHKENVDRILTLLYCLWYPKTSGLQRSLSRKKTIRRAVLQVSEQHQGCLLLILLSDTSLLHSWHLIPLSSTHRYETFTASPKNQTSVCSLTTPTLVMPPLFFLTSSPLHLSNSLLDILCQFLLHLPLSLLRVAVYHWLMELDGCFPVKEIQLRSPT